jgi:hypothetical protein
MRVQYPENKAKIGHCLERAHCYTPSQVVTVLFCYGLLFAKNKIKKMSLRKNYTYGEIIVPPKQVSDTEINAYFLSEREKKLESTTRTKQGSIEPQILRSQYYPIE